jgi:SAM-dependent methyltransferase
MAIHDLLAPVTRRLRASRHWLRHRLRLYQSPERLAADAQQYWTSGPNEVPAQNFHWRGSGMFQDDAAWLAIGKDHFELYEAFARMVGFQRPARRVIEWGCGGGANAVHFAREAERFIGVDVSPDALQECERQLRSEGLSNFTPVLADVADPEPAAADFRGQCDLFLCTYVFELLPTPEHGERLLRVARSVLSAGGMALVQVKYATHEIHTLSRRAGYRRNPANMTSYRIEEFWTLATAAGFQPKAVTLVPRQPLVQDERYAYFLLMG